MRSGWGDMPVLLLTSVGDPPLLFEMLEISCDVPRRRRGVLSSPPAALDTALTAGQDNMCLSYWLIARGCESQCQAIAFFKLWGRYQRSQV